MLDEESSSLFGSDDEEDEEKRKDNSEDKKYHFRKEFRTMIYGFGDDKVCLLPDCICRSPVELCIKVRVE